ncbi:MAG: lipoate--protein ligase family protein [Chlamydiae bacterium]|nr:lipoate--protein ligase family protein [Chlamydiota bacterium]
MTLYWLELDKDCSILEQLQIEEALLRNDTRNFCIVNKGSSPAIVIGISGKIHELVDLEIAKLLQLPIIKRFSGGGTVVVDENTLFITFIFQKETLPFPAYPEKIMKWSEGIYKKVFPKNFLLKENDYAFEDKKFGGNAQYIRKDRWLHHTSFLWDYQTSHMQALKHPKKTPSYRAGRDHGNFLCKLKEFIPSQDDLLADLKNALSEEFDLSHVPLESIQISETHRTTTQLISDLF